MSKVIMFRPDVPENSCDFREFKNKDAFLAKINC
jgi:hypothetical protein